VTTVTDRADGKATSERKKSRRLIGDIYDAALDPGLWVNALERTCTYVGGVAAALQSHDVLQKKRLVSISAERQPEYTKTYIETYAKLNPAIVPAMIQTPVGQVSTSWISSRSTNMRSGLYKECPPRRAISTQPGGARQIRHQFAAAP